MDDLGKRGKQRRPLLISRSHQILKHKPESHAFTREESVKAHSLLTMFPKGLRTSDEKRRAEEWLREHPMGDLFGLDPQMSAALIATLLIGGSLLIGFMKK